MKSNNKIKEEYFEEIIKKIRTKEELIFFLEEIATLRQIIFKDRETLLSKKAEGRVSEELKKLIEKLEREGAIFESHKEQSAFLEELEKKLQSSPMIKLEIAFSPNNSCLDRISQWLKKELGQKTILDLTINPEIIGGVIIEYRGNWRDFTLAKEIDKLIFQKLI